MNIQHPTFNKQRPSENRREFLRDCGRGAALVLLGAVGFLLFSRRGDAAKTEARCTNRGICEGCEAYADCGLPQALSKKRETTRQD